MGWNAPAELSVVMVTMSSLELLPSDDNETPWLAQKSSRLLGDQGAYWDSCQRDLKDLHCEQGRPLLRVVPPDVWLRRHDGSLAGERCVYSWQGAPPSLIHPAHPSLPYVAAAADDDDDHHHPLAAAAAAAAAAALPRPAGAALDAAAAAAAAPGAFLLRIYIALLCTGSVSESGARSSPGEDGMMIMRWLR